MDWGVPLGTERSLDQRSQFTDQKGIEMTRNLKLKAVGLGLLATLAMSAFAASSAFSNIEAHQGGHFTAEGPLPVTVHGHSNETHRVHLNMFGQSITCTVTWSGSQSEETETQLTIVATYTECFSGGNLATFKMNGCHSTFTIRDTNASTLHNDTHFVCPLGAKAEFSRNDGSCNVTFPPQTITNAVTYTTIIGANGKHAITADITEHGLTYEKHGACVFLAPFGTGPHVGASLTGSMTLEGTNALGSATNITATGRNGH